MVPGFVAAPTRLVFISPYSFFFNLFISVYFILFFFFFFFFFLGGGGGGGVKISLDKQGHGLRHPSHYIILDMRQFQNTVENHNETFQLRVSHNLHGPHE